VFQLIVDELPKLKSDWENGGEGGREVGENRMLQFLCIRLSWKKVGTVGFDCCCACAQPQKLELGVGSVGGGRKKFSHTKMLRVGCRCSLVD
jgi:hypothetical protein